LKQLPCDASAFYDVEGFDRKLIKKIALVAMNVKRSKGKRPYQGALQAIRENICKDGTITYEHAKAGFYAFIEKHKGIENYICSDFGIKGMFYDSLIMEGCMYELMVKPKQRIVIYSAHDELVCPADPDIVKIVLAQMEKSYCKVIKDALVKSHKLNKNDPLPEWIKPSIKQS